MASRKGIACESAEVLGLNQADLSMLYVFFWVIPRRLNFICRRFGTLCLFHLHRRVGMKTGESNGNLPLRTSPGCSVPEPYRSPDWVLVPAKPG